MLLIPGSSWSQIAQRGRQGCQGRWDGARCCSGRGSGVWLADCASPGSRLCFQQPARHLCSSSLPGADGQKRAHRVRAQGLHPGSRAQARSAAADSLGSRGPLSEGRSRVSVPPCWTQSCPSPGCEHRSVTQAGTWALRQALAGRGSGKWTCSSPDPAPGTPASGRPGASTPARVAVTFQTAM